MQLPKPMIRLEFHCHTIFSKDSLVQLPNLLHACKQKSIDRVVITDHNTIAGAVIAQQLDPQRVIIGEEIMTTAGELLAAFVQEEVPPGLPPLEVIARLRGQGAFISVSHPFDRLRAGGWAIQDLKAIVPLIDAIETFNARCLLPGFNRRAGRFANQYDLPGTAGSDAHSIIELGKATLLLPPFTGADGLRTALPNAQIQSRLSPPWLHLSSRYAQWYKRLFGAALLKPDAG